MSDKDDENVKTKQQQQERNFKMSVCQLVCEYQLYEAASYNCVFNEEKCGFNS